ncbi:MAG: hypothetical protein SGJ20_22090 [Planctomycetota bacterium]|nr:hypothetical protein [Planctomycetota bacterium]
MTRGIASVVLCAAIGMSLLAGPARAGIGCAHCGCSEPCNKVCRLVKEEKKVKVICWGTKCEDFCVPGPSTPGCTHCEEVCTDCDSCNDRAAHGAPTKFVWTDWIPGSCSKVYTKKKLMQKIVTKKVDSYKWVVEDLCPACDAQAVSVKPAEGAEVPAPPVANAKLPPTAK